MINMFVMMLMHSFVNTCRYYLLGLDHNCGGGSRRFVYLLSPCDPHHGHLLRVHICHQQTQAQADQHKNCCQERYQRKVRNTICSSTKG